MNVNFKALEDTIAAENSTLVHPDPIEVRGMDPSVTSDAVVAAQKRATDLVDNICNNTLVVLQQRSDELLNTMERLRKSRSALAHYIGEFAARNADALRLAEDIRKLIDEAASPFKADPPATITDLKGDAK